MPRGPLRLPRAVARLVFAALAAASAGAQAVPAAAAPAPAAQPSGAAAVRSAPPLIAVPAAQRATRPAPLRLAESAAAPNATLSPAAVGARDELVAMRAWNAGGGRPRQVGFARPLPVPLELRLEASAAWPRRGRLGGGVAGPLAEAEAYRPEVILLDIGMPVVNGYDACRRIREFDWGREALLIALTGWGQEEDRERSRAAGFDHHMVKPVDPDLLMRQLAKHAANREARRAVPSA
jgi:CheY-like chemotaxis protein